MGYLNIWKKGHPYSPSCQLVTFLLSRWSLPSPQECLQAARSVKCQEELDNQFSSFLLDCKLLLVLHWHWPRLLIPPPEDGQIAVHILSASFVHLLAITLLRSLFFSCVFLAQYEPCRRMTISDPVFAFQSVASLVLAECVEVTSTVQQEDLFYACFGQIYVETLLFLSVSSYAARYMFIWINIHVVRAHTCT